MTQLRLVTNVLCRCIILLYGEGRPSWQGDNKGLPRWIPKSQNILDGQRNEYHENGGVSKHN